MAISPTPSQHEASQGSSRQQRQQSPPSRQSYPYPQDLVRTIVRLACRLSRDQHSPQDGPRSLMLDYPTTLTLALLSREVYSYVATILYDHVVINKISQLKLFVRALQLRPPLGRLVRSLWIGDMEAWQESWSVLLGDSPTKVEIESSIQNAELLPDQVAPGTLFLIPQDENELQEYRTRDAMDPEDELRAQIAELLYQTQQTVGHDGTGVCLGRSGYDSNMRHIGQDEWLSRVYHLQGRLDAVLLQIAQDGKWTDINRYLAIPPQPPHTGPDYFGHPLIYVRSGSSAMIWPDPPQSQDATSQSDLADPDQVEDFADLFHAGPQLAPGQLTYNTYSQDTIGGLLSAVRILLVMTPYLQHLGLAHYLMRAVVGCRTPVDLPRLKTLFLGAPPDFWDCRLDFLHRSLDSVEKLCISGCMLFEEEAKSIAGEHDELPSLQEFRWSTFEPHASSHPIGLLDTIKVLLSTPHNSSRTRPIFVSALVDRIDEAIFHFTAPDELRDNPRLEVRRYLPGDVPSVRETRNKAGMAKALFEKEVIKGRGPGMCSECGWPEEDECECEDE